MKWLKRIHLPRLTILPKLLISFLVLSSLPLIGLGYFANKNLRETGLEAVAGVDEMGERNLKAARALGERAIEDSVRALDVKSTEAIEVRTVDLAGRIADFLYARDQDLLLLASFLPDPLRYLSAYQACTRDVIVHGPWPPREAKPETNPSALMWENPENRTSWRHRSPDDFKKLPLPLFKEITFVDLDGMERIKITDGLISNDLKDVSRRENTYCKAEDYFSHVSRLGNRQIYVSEVIGAYVEGWLYKSPEGIRVKPESAYAGKENPEGRRFEGIIRWVTPVYENDKRIGYLTMALDHTHIMEFTDHVVPTEERFSDISDGGSGNYAFLWDHQDRCISHPRDFFICGFDPLTGQRVPGWISGQTYEAFKTSELSLGEFVETLPSFRAFSQGKKGSKEQLKSGKISLDCRILDSAPQCQGWHRGTEDGGSGSFVILWSGLWKFTSYATVPYYTGMYGKSKRGFGYVTIGANVADFHKAANSTKEYIGSTISEQAKAIDITRQRTRRSINQNEERHRNLLTIIAILSAAVVAAASVMLSLNLSGPVKRLTEGAAAMSRGDLEQQIEVKSRDEIGQLAESFNTMAATVADLDRMKSDFVTIASHELRTPIHAMLLAVSGILEGYAGEVTEEVREDLETVTSGITRLTRLISDLLDISRIEARKFDLNIERTTVTEVVDKSVQEVSDLLKNHEHVVLKSVPPNIPDVDVDKDRMIQVMVNLLSNSIKYTPDGGKILIRAVGKGDNVVISVADNGYGIPTWAQNKIFDKFFQADSIMSHRVGGSGLGLTIAKGVVEEHGGTINCESPISDKWSSELPLGEERKGAVFNIELPAIRA